MPSDKVEGTLRDVFTKMRRQDFNPDLLIADRAAKANLQAGRTFDAFRRANRSTRLPSQAVLR